MSRKFFTLPQPSPMPWGGSKKFTNDLGLLYIVSMSILIMIFLQQYVFCRARRDRV